MDSETSNSSTEKSSLSEIASTPQTAGSTPKKRVKFIANERNSSVDVENVHTLKQLADEINDGHTEVLEHVKTCVGAILLAVKRKALVGQKLIEAKELLPLGKWMPWLERYCPNIEQRTANRYMAFAKLWPEVGPKLEAVASWTGLSNGDRLRLVWRLMGAAAAGGDQAEPDLVETAVPETVRASAVERWAGWLSQRIDRIRVSDLVEEEKTSLRASLEPAVRLYEALGT
jgi:hypothetical protein